MRPLFRRYGNLTGYCHLSVLFIVTFCCLYGCAVSGGGRVSKDLNERNIAVLVLKDSDPYSWRGAKKAFTSLTMWEAKGLEWKLLQEVEGSGLFEHVTRYEDPLTYNLKPAYELSLYGAWFARHEKESVMAKEFVDVPIPAWVAETSGREIVTQRGLMGRYELKDRRSGEIVAKWYSFSAASFPEDKMKVPVLAQTLLEDEHRAILHSVAPADVTATAQRAVSIMSPPSAGNNEVIAQVPADSESGLLIAGRSTHTFEQGLEQFIAEGENLAGSPLYTYFSTIDVSYIKEQTADLHQSLVAALVEQIGESPMQYFPWKGDYKLAFDIMRLNFWHDSERRAFGVAEIGVQLILLSERRILFEQNPPLIVSVRKSTPGGKKPMALLCQDAAAKIAQLLKNYLAQGHGGTP